ncbi:uncharacterized protein BO88DRAFT_457887 [Aspergillus vadensis CBS 113365]|uniref:Uncharacterized protein n=1 Tax=Aspergillus vadensis (strain CBS 113365 / IMI 142717 / IBT 24658) TaxID=1448311 RepID=A0A319AYI9_ASPVC|nr:hypothetical protein BO88DRAFT_457887 [Aspergillus vadensis CBS 113365]PYH64664.1 hypothetical protein BO88DRAFT_457887 [Aspergillus vadensis CBS 113365]
MAQAAWPQSQSNTSWSDFITPLKRNTSLLKRAFETNPTITKRALDNSARRSTHDELGAVLLMMFIMFCYASAWYGMKLPLHRVLRTPEGTSHSTTEDWLRDALLVLTVALVCSFASWLLGLYLRHHAMQSWWYGQISLVLGILETAIDVLLAVVWIRGLYAVWHLRYRFRNWRRRRR